MPKVPECLVAVVGVDDSELAVLTVGVVAQADAVVPSVVVPGVGGVLLAVCDSVHTHIHR